MGYKIYITDDINTAELDTEDIQPKTIFALLDIQDIGSKKNNIQSLTFKGTDNNNTAFGFYFDFGRTTNLSDLNKIFFNYNPIRAVKVLVYEDTDLIFIGDLRISTINIDKDNNILYECVVSTSLTLLKTALSNSFLRDLNFYDLTHRYTYTNMESCWNQILETWSASSQTFVSGYTGIGVGYSYPLIDYGYRFNDVSGTYSGDTIPAIKINSIRNFKPALYLKEYLNRIFEQDILDGFSYEIKGDSDFQTMFNHITIPETNENLQDYATGFTTTMEITAPYAEFLEYNQILFPPDVPIACITRILNTDSFIQSPLPFTNYLETTGFYGGGGIILRNIKSSIKVQGNIKIQSLTEGCITPGASTTATIQLTQYSDTLARTLIIGSYSIIIPYDTEVTEDFSILVNDVTLNQYDFLYIQLYVQSDFVNPPPPVTNAYKITLYSCAATVPATTGDSFYYYTAPSLDTSTADYITPKAPVNIKQLDFLKSIINQFNFVVYTENTNYKHIIFEKYDDFYAKTTPINILNNSLNWTNKIDYSNGLTIKSNIELPKSYTFTYKSDDDFLNKDYKTKYNEIYGQFQFNDELGLSDDKKVELIFSPTIITTIDNFIKPLFYKVESGLVVPTKINPRIMYYNGYEYYDSLDGNEYVGYEEIGATGITITTKFDKYPQISNYYLISSYDVNNFPIYSVVNDIHFNQPKQIYFTDTNNLFTNSPNSYSNYYLNQITDITSEDVIYVDCNVLLNTIDISNLDLSVPIWINTGLNNGAYFKVLNIEYENKNIPSKVMLQKIDLDTTYIPLAPFTGFTFIVDTRDEIISGFVFEMYLDFITTTTFDVDWGDGIIETLILSGSGTYVRHNFTGRNMFSINIKVSDTNNITSLVMENENYGGKNYISSINIEQLNWLTYFSINNNKLTSLNLDNNVQIVELYCQQNKLKTLNIPSLIYLQTLYCAFNEITTLVFNKLHMIQLEVSENNLTSLDLYQCYNLIEVDADGNGSLTGLTDYTYTNTSLLNINFYNCSLNETSINMILAAAALTALENGAMNIQQNPSMPPSGQGIIDRSILVTRLWYLSTD